jgi:hypothetical protein
LVGTPQDLKVAKDARRAVGKDLLESGKAIWKDPNVVPADTAPVVKKIDEYLSGPNRGNDEAQTALTNIKNKLLKTDGTPETDPEYLYKSVIKHINDKLDKYDPADKISQAMKASAPMVREVKEALQDTLQASVPGYGDYRAAYTKASAPVNQLSFLQDLNLINPENPTSKPTLNKISAALKEISELRSQKGWNEAKMLTPEQLQGLENLRDDLARAAQARGLANQAGGSPTARRTAINDKIKDVLGTNTEGRIINPTNIGASVGSTIGATIGQHFGVPFGGGELGAAAGAGIGHALSRVGTSEAGRVQNKLVDMFLNPSNYSSSAPVQSFYPSIGEQPGLQRFLRLTAPVAATAAGRGK